MTDRKKRRGVDLCERLFVNGDESGTCLLPNGHAGPCSDGVPVHVEVGGNLYLPATTIDFTWRPLRRKSAS